MNATQLLEHFGRLSEAPGAVPRLRRFILDLAVRGKLVEQDLKDEPAVELLKRIRLEKVRLLKKGATRKASDAVEVSEDSRLYVIPSNWAWTNLAEIADFSAGRTPSRHETVFWNTGDYPWVSIRDMKAGETLFNTSETVSETAKLKVFGSEPVPAGTLIMSFKLTIGRISRLGMPAFHNEAIISIRPHLPSLDPYLFKVLPLFAQSGNSKDAIKGATLNRESLSNIPIALPPLAEQHRIVAKVDELMALCDQLEAAQQERDRRRDLLAAASLQRLNQPAADTAPEAQREHARFHLHHLPRLTTRPEQIKALRQTFLNLAIRGKLLPQVEADGRAQDALSAAFDVRRTLIKKGQLAQKWLTATAWLDERPFELPKQWIAASFDQLAAPVANALKAGPFGSALKKEFYAATGYKIYGQEQVIGQDPHLGNYYISDQKYVELQSCAVKAGDLLISLVGTIGKVLILPPECEPGIINPRLIKMTLNGKVIVAEYVSLLLQAPWVRDFLFAQSHGTTMDVLNLTILRSLPVPVPPLPEQHRIVAKVDELMALCDQLEAQLTTTQTDSRRLLEAVLDAALVPV